MVEWTVLFVDESERSASSIVDTCGARNGSSAGLFNASVMSSNPRCSTASGCDETQRAYSRSRASFSDRSLPSARRDGDWGITASVSASGNASRFGVRLK